MSQFVGIAQIANQYECVVQDVDQTICIEIPLSAAGHTLAKTPNQGKSITQNVNRSIKVNVSQQSTCDSVGRCDQRTHVKIVIGQRDLAIEQIKINGDRSSS